MTSQSATAELAELEQTISAAVASGDLEAVAIARDQWRRIYEIARACGDA